MGGAASKAKGSRVERELTHAFTDAGVPSRRVVGSGAHGHRQKILDGDIQVGVYGHHDIKECKEQLFIAEVKARKNGAGFKVLEGWLGDDDILLLKRNRTDPMAVMPWRTLVSLLEVYYQVMVPEAMVPTIEEKE